MVIAGAASTAGHHLYRPRCAETVWLVWRLWPGRYRTVDGLYWPAAGLPDGPGRRFGRIFRRLVAVGRVAHAPRCLGVGVYYGGRDLHGPHWSWIVYEQQWL